MDRTVTQHLNERIQELVIELALLKDNQRRLERHNNRLYIGIFVLFAITWILMGLIFLMIDGTIKVVSL